MVVDYSIKIDSLFPDNDSGKFLYRQYLAENDFSSWTNQNSWSATANGAKLAKGKTSFLRNYYSVNRRSFFVTFIPSDDSKFSVGIDNEDFAFGSNFWEAVVDVASQTVSYREDERPYKLEKDHTYKLELNTYDNNTSFSIVDLSDASNTIEFSALRTQAQDFYGIRMLGGTSPTFSHIGVCAHVPNPYVMFFGNSITAGAGTNFVDGHPVNAYPYLVGEAIGKPYLTSGRGGTTIIELLGDGTFKGRIETELAILRPKYAVITIGTNGNNTYENLTELVRLVRSSGTIPILNNIPCESIFYDNRWHDYDDSRNRLIDSVRKETGVNGAQFELATSLNGNGLTADPKLYVVDPVGQDIIRIHPNDNGHKKLFERLKQDCPELFGE